MDGLNGWTDTVPALLRSFLVGRFNPAGFCRRIHRRRTCVFLPVRPGQPAPVSTVMTGTSDA
ncbi:hypothetical protein [uncultured Methanoregula sp.]|uniref:hypothetical protein n=1 Tax=uncultured Methanoregula sp. TaxID=1005933 RepID=UPI003749222E